MFQHQWFTVRFNRMSDGGVPRPPAIVFVIPRYRMMSAHAAAAVRCFVDADQYGDVRIEIIAEVIPFVRALPRYGQTTRRCVGRIDYCKRGRLNSRMPLKVGP